MFKIPIGMLCISIFFSGCILNLEVKNIPPVKIAETDLAREIYITDTFSKPIDSTTIFTDQDAEVISYIRYMHLSGKHHLKWEWYDPKGNLYCATDDYPITASKGKYIEEGTSWHKISIKNSKAQNYPGKWTVKIFLDGVFSASNSFELRQTSASMNFGDYYALVIGNNDYHVLPKLTTAKNDAKALAKILTRDYGFNMRLLIDASRSDIILALNGFRRKLSEHDNLLIFYAGHGWLDKKGDEGYWLPVDADNDNEINWISNSYIATALKAISAKHIIVIADSCYSGKLTRADGYTRIRLQDLEKYYNEIACKKARCVLSSGGLEPVVDNGGKGNHSVFTSALLDALENNHRIIDGTTLFNSVRRKVMLCSDQTPEYADIRKAGHDGGDFLFIRKTE